MGAESVKGMPEGGLVPYLGKVIRIRYRLKHPEHGWTYNLEERIVDGGSVIDHLTIPHAVLLAGLEAFARYTVGQELKCPMGIREVQDRKWSFSKGIVLYRIGNARLKYPGKFRTQEWIDAVTISWEDDTDLAATGAANLDGIL